MSNVHYKETQHFNNDIMLAILGLVALASVVRGIDYLWSAEPKVWAATTLFVTATAAGTLIWWLSRLKLKVSITEKNVKYKLSPLHGKKQSIAWNQIDTCKVVKTPTEAQWAGGNITFNHEKRYSLTGRNGLAIHTKEGENIFIGCSDIALLQSTMDKLKSIRLSTI